MGSQKQRALRSARKFVSYVDRHYKKVTRAFLFGSFATGRQHRGSDIDVALISPLFSRDAYRDQVEMMKFKGKIDLDIEPHPFHPSAFVEEDPLVWEIKCHGIQIK